MVHYRLLNPDSDLPALAALLNLTATVPVTPELLAEWRRRAHPDRLRQQLIAVDDADALIGIGDCVRDPWMPSGQFWIDVAVAPEHRQQGIGTVLYDASEAWALEQGGLYFGADVRDDQPEGLHFARARRFVTIQHTAEYQLALAEFNPDIFAQRSASLAADGFEFLSFEAAGDTRDHRKAVYKLHKRVILDDPTFTGLHLPFAEYSKRIFDSPWTRADELIVALRGAAWVGYAQLADFPDSATVMLSYAGVEEAFRRRGLATVLSALALAHAKTRGVISARFTIDLRDEPALALTARLGAAAEAGSQRMIRNRGSE